MNDLVKVLQPTIALGDPHMWTDGKDRLSIRFFIYETLLQFNQDGTFRPLLAKSWQCSEDARTWTFPLRDDVRFHNGKALSAADVIACLERVKDPGMPGELGTDGLYAAYIGGATFSAQGENTVVIQLTEPIADLLDILVYLPITPAGDFDSLEQTPLGSGPYRFVRQDEQGILLERNQDYWGAPAAYDGILWQAEANAERRVQALLDGQVDLISEVPVGEINRPGLQIVSQHSHWTTIFMLNCAQGPCADKRVRQALNYGADVQAMIDTLLHGAADRLNGPLTPSHFGYDPSSPAYPYDPEKAKALLKEAGYEHGLTLTFDVPLRHPDESLAIAKLLADQYKKINLELIIRTYRDRPAYAMMVKSKAIGDACAFDSSPLSTYRILKEKFHSGVAGSWWQGYDNETVNQTMEKAWQTKDTTQRRLYYQQVVNEIQDDAAWLFLYSPVIYWAVGEKLRYWKVGLNGLVQF